MKQSVGGLPLWSACRGGVEVRFVGKGPALEREQVLRAIESRTPEEDCPVAWVRQCHSARGREATGPGEVGEGDALWTREPGLALSVVTTDCVPVVVGAEGVLVVIHAGWRGIVAGVVPAALAGAGLDAGGGRAWIGPAIGACCYEVGEEVAEQIRGVGLESAVLPGRGSRPHVDLRAAVRRQLEESGVGPVDQRGPCTRCTPERLWSYRLEGPGAGRNLTFAWLTL